MLVNVKISKKNFYEYIINDVYHLIKLESLKKIFKYKNKQ